MAAAALSQLRDDSSLPAPAVFPGGSPPPPQWPLPVAAVLSGLSTFSLSPGLQLYIFF